MITDKIKSAYYLFLVRILIAIVPLLHGNLRIKMNRAVFSATRKIKDDDMIAAVLIDLAPYLNDELKIQALGITHEINDEYLRAAVLAELARHFSNELKKQVVEEEIENIRKISDKSVRALALLALTPIMEQEIKEQVVQEVSAITNEIKDEHDYFHVLVGFARHLSKNSRLLVLQKALSVARNISDDVNRVRALIIISLYLDGELEEQVRKEIFTADNKVALSKNSDLRPLLESPPPLLSMVQRPTKAAKADEVTFTASHPKEGNIEFWHTLLVFAHIPRALAKVRRDVKRFNDQIKSPKETTSRSLTQITRGTELTIVPSCEGVTFNPERVSFKWMEDFHRADFRFKADKSLSDDAVKGQITIYVGPLIVGTLKFAMLFNDKEMKPVEHEECAKMYGNDDVFISYSRKDTEVARAFKNILEATGLDVFLDVDNLRSGQLWEDELKRRIERAKIFQIFWSTNYSQSENCTLEWKYALQQNKDEGYIRPVYWNNPLSPKPPEELNKFNFKYVELKIPNGE